MSNYKINNYDVFSGIYDEFRIQGDFFAQYELKFGSKFINSAFSRLPQKLNLLELGCGTGIWSKIIFEIAEENRKSLKCYLVEPSIGMIKKAKSKLENRNATFKNYDASSLLIKKINIKFDCIVSALSIDAIGINIFKLILNYYLKGDGIALFWIFNHERYNSITDKIVKVWTFNNKKIEIPSFKILKKDIIDTFDDLIYNLEIHEIKLPKINDISREIFFCEISKHGM